MNKSKEALVKEFGAEIGGKLFGAAVKLSARYSIDLADVCQDMAIEALAIRESYGFVHVNTVVSRTKGALLSGKSGYRYGTNDHYTEQDCGEIVLSDLGLGGNRYDVFADEREASDNDNKDDRLIEFIDKSVIEYDLQERFYETLDTLDADTKTVALGIMAGYSQSEIAASLGKSNAYVSVRKGRLEEAFGWAI